MNQDNYLCEALKMRNLVSEFNPPHYNNDAEVGAAFAPAQPLPQPVKPGGRLWPRAGPGGRVGGSLLPAAAWRCALQPHGLCPWPG